jgi:hypothetical protein
MMHAEDLTWLAEAREILRDAGHDPDDVYVDEVNGQVKFVYDLPEEE